MTQIISQNRAMVPALDVPTNKAIEIVKQTGDLDGVGAYKF